MSRPGGKREGLPGEVKELWALVVAYAKQETVDPLKSVGRSLAFGLAGAVALSLGLLLLLLGGLRALQTETGSTFAGRWSWAPYALTLLAAVAVAGLAIRAGTGGKSRGGGRA